MAKDTKIRILDAALEIFARDGYAGTNIKDIADAVGIVKSALYRHFESKEAIWDAVADMVAEHYTENFGPTDHVPVMPKTTDGLYHMTMGMVNFTMHDPKIVQTRKILLTEQFRNDKVKELANNYFLYGMEARFTKIFESMMAAGTIKEDDPATLAFAYTSPITSLIHLCDRDPAKEPEAMERLHRFVDHFIKVYSC